MSASYARTSITGLTCFLMGLIVGLFTAPRRGSEVRRAVGRRMLAAADSVLVGVHLRPARLRQENAEDLLA